MWIIELAIEVIRSIPPLLDAIAWPILAVVALRLFRPQLASLLTRIRKGGGAEFYPLQQSTESSPGILPTTDLPTTSETTTNPPFPRTPAIRKVEDLIRSFHPFASATAPADRENILITLSARAILIALFEQVEASIWESQIALLTHLNSNIGGVTRKDLQHDFYEPATNRYPEIFASYSYDSYLQFLVNTGLVMDSEGMVSITDQGREYLVWRAESRKAPKMFG